MFLACLVVSQKIVVKNLTFMSDSLPMVCNHPVKSAGYTYCERGEIIFSSCRVISQNHLAQCHVNLQIGVYQNKSPFCQVWWLQRLWQRIYNDFSLSRDLERKGDQRVTQVYKWELLMISHYPDKFGYHRSFGKRLYNNFSG